MESIDTSLLSEDQQYEMAQAAMCAYGLESVCPEQLPGGKGDETLDYNRFKVLECRGAEGGRPPSILCEVVYGAPWVDPTDRVDKYIDLYKRRFRVYMSSSPDGLRALREDTQAWPQDAEGNRLEPLEENARFMPLWAQDSGLPQDGHFYADVYAEPGLQAVGEMPSMEPEWKIITPQQWANIMHHAGFPQEMREALRASFPEGAVKLQYETLGGAWNSSGRSGVSTLVGLVWEICAGADESLCKIQDIALTLATDPEYEPLLLHSAEWQKKLGQDAPEDERIPTPEILREPRRYYGKELYFVQRTFPGEHFRMQEGHLASLGKALGRIHNRPANEASPPPVRSVLHAERLIESVKEGLKDAELRTQEGKRHGTRERMRQSILGCLLERFSYDEIKRRDPDLCREVGLTRAVAEQHARMQRKKAKEDDALPQGLCHGDMHALNVLTAGEDKISILDFQLTGKGVFVDELVLALYFFCVDGQGQLDAGKTRAFFDAYREARCRDDKSTGNVPLTQEELRVIPERLAALAQRQTHPVWEMFRNKAEKDYSAFAERNQVLPEQMRQFQQEGGGIERFAREFVGVGLEELAKAPKPAHAHKVGRKPPVAGSRKDKDNGALMPWTARTTEMQKSDLPLQGSGM